MRKAITSVVMVCLILASVLAVGAVAQPSEKVPVIVGFKDKPDADLIRAHGGRIKYMYNLIPAIACKLPEQAIDALKNNPKVAYVEVDGVVESIDEVLPWGVDRIDAELEHPYNKGTGVKISVIDTGIDYNHPDLDSNYKGGYDFVNDDADPMDDHGHGTHVAGIIAAEDNEIGVIGVAPESSLYALKALNSRGRGYVSDIVAAIDWSVSYGMQIISMSIGTNTNYMSIRTACDNAYAAGLLLVAAGGNDATPWSVRLGWDTIDYPARYDSVIAVGATQSNDARAIWSSTGPELELAAPGVGIYSTYWDDTYATLSGTSMACPHVTGTAALVFKTPVDPAYDSDGDGAWDAVEVRKKLQDTADDLGDPWRDPWYGYGLVDADEAAPSNTMHVKSIGMSTETMGRWRWSWTRAVAIVTIVDANDNPVEGATITGHWSGLTSQDVSEVTDANGHVTFKSKYVKNASGTFTFTVDNVEEPGWMYDFSANLETSDEITV